MDEKKEEQGHVIPNSRYDLKGDFYFRKETRVREQRREEMTNESGERD